MSNLINYAQQKLKQTTVSLGLKGKTHNFYTNVLAERYDLNHLYKEFIRFNRNIKKIQRMLKWKLY